jgi:glutamate-1-semialdehyde 2,1-aminomutase
MKNKKNQLLYKKAKKFISGGNMFLSKRPELFLPGGWPTYFEKTKGCEVWDLEKITFYELSLMGVGTNAVGYCDPVVDSKVKSIIKKGNMSSLNCPEEVLLAEKLIELHPWAQKVKFARTGGEANAIAIRIARAASGRENVAFCGYHGWHDWYLATNIVKNKNLNEHLLKDIPTQGVPKDLKGTIYPFKYNDFNELVKLVKRKKIGVICMEVMRNKPPKDNFLQKVRNLASKNGIVLIFDECTSGFRKNYGGLHKYFNIIPDMALFGKALGNGYAITAVIGKNEIMEYAQKSFMSSTFWSERIGPAAALATLKTMKKVKSWKKIDNNGKKIIERWKKLSKKYEIKIDIFGLPALCSFIFLSKNSQKYKTFITQEMLKKGFLASNAVYSCTSHTNAILEKYFWELEKIFKVIQDCENGLDINKILKYPVSHSSFQRLN